MPGSTRDDAARLLAARGLTEAELRERLTRLGHPPLEVEAAVREALHAGWINDAALCRAVLREGLAKGRGKERLLAQLLSRGIVPELAETAWDALLASGDVDPGESLRLEVERRVKAEGGALTGKAAARIYNALLRSGHDPESARSAL
ncbi:MAG TPA: regulatory protein RecX, partial [Candidatus Polarisedimenticolaceae bacterium]|nr:regulatory protein RecX [Candidatus Polarisedimenticolaceae bacterium]